MNVRELELELAYAFKQYKSERYGPREDHWLLRMGELALELEAIKLGGQLAWQPK